MKRFSQMILLAVLAGILMLGACNKEEDVVVAKTDAINLTIDDAVASDLSDEVINDAESILAGGEASNFEYATKESGTEAVSRTITVDKPGDVTDYPKKITVTYVNWTGATDRIKNGVLKITVSDKMWNSGAVRTITFENFTINGYLIEGTKTVTYKGKISDQPTLEVKLTSGRVTSPDGLYSIERSFTHTRTMVEGAGTVFNIWDDVWEITGSGQGKGRKGLSYKVNIKEPLVYKTICPWISQGVLEIDIEKSKKVSIDFGDGTCNRAFSITVDGSKSDGNSLD